MLMMLSVLILTMFLSLPPLSSSADPSQECGPTTQDFDTPTFEGSLLGVVTDKEEVGSFIMDLVAVSGDGNSHISYELIENPGNYFSLNSGLTWDNRTRGRLTIARQVDRDALAPPNNILILTVRASAGIGKY